MEATTPRVSVLTVAGRSSALLGATVQSLHEQNLRNFELVVVADGAAEPATEGAPKDGRVRVVHVTETTEAGRWSAGFELCRGAYVALLEAGDTCLPARLARQAAVLDRDPAVVLVGSKTAPHTPGKHDVPQPALTDTGSTAWWLHVGGAMPLSSLMLRRETVMAQGPLMRDEHPGAADFDLCLRLAALGDVARVDEVLTLCRHGAGVPDAPRVAAMRQLLEEAYEPILGGSAPRAATLVARHVIGDAPVTDSATLEEVESVLVSLGYWLRQAGKADGVSRAFIAGERSALLQRMARGLGKRQAARVANAASATPATARRIPWFGGVRTALSGS